MKSDSAEQLQRRASLPFKVEPSKPIGAPEKAIRIGHTTIGGHELTIIAGPCSITDRAHTFALAETVKRSGAHFFHGGTLNSHSSRSQTQGLDEEGLKILAEVRERYELKVVTEALDERGVDLLRHYVDVVQIGTSNMQNISLLKMAGRSLLPVLLKRGIAATLDEWLLAAECVMAEGNQNVILCECGIRTFAQHPRYTPDFAVIPAVHATSHLPIIFDPSNIGENYLVRPLSLAGIAAGGDGLMVEINDSENALCSNPNAIALDQYEELVLDVRAIHKVMRLYPSQF